MTSPFGEYYESEGSSGREGDLKEEGWEGLGFSDENHTSSYFIFTFDQWRLMSFECVRMIR